MLIRTLTLLALTLLGSNSTFAQTLPKEGTAIVSGRVTLKGDPVSDVAIGLQPVSRTGFQDSSKLLRTRTDADGRFRFSGLNADQYLITALAPGLIAPSDTPYEPQGKALTVANGEVIENLTLELKRGGVITGRITDAQNNPVVEIVVRLAKMDSSGKFNSYVSSEIAQYYRTDDRGTYRLFSLPAGKYKVSVGEPIRLPGGIPPSGMGSYYPQTFYPGTPNEAQAKILEVSEGSEATDVDIKVGAAKELYTASGKVVDAESGKPVGGVRVGFGTPNERGQLDAFIPNDITANAQGEFEFPSLMPGKYLAFISVLGDNNEFYSEPTPFEVGESNVLGLEIKAIRGLSISGVVAFEGPMDSSPRPNLSQLRVIASPASRSVVPLNHAAQVAANGSFRITGLRPGKFSLFPSPRLPGMALMRIEHNGAPIRDNLELQSGEHLSNIKLVFGPATGVLRGQVRFVGGAPPEGSNYRITVSRVGGSSTNNSGAAVDARGQFVVKDLAAGEHEVKIFLLLSSTPTAEISRLMSLLRQYSQLVTVAGSGETQIELVIDLSKKEND